MPGDPEDCRKHATHCADLALKSRTPQLQVMFWDLAKDWERFAIQLDEVFDKNHEREAIRSNIQESLYEFMRLSALPIWNKIGID